MTKLFHVMLSAIHILLLLFYKYFNDIEELDKQRRKDFKEYEMEKEFNRTQELKKMDKEHREEAKKKYEEEKKEHKKHEKVRRRFINSDVNVMK